MSSEQERAPLCIIASQTKKHFSGHDEHISKDSREVVSRSEEQWKVDSIHSYTLWVWVCVQWEGGGGGREGKKVKPKAVNLIGLCCSQ